MKKSFRNRWSNQTIKIKKKLPVVICNSDVVSNLNFSDLLTFHKQNKSVATLVVKQINQKILMGL